MEKKSYYVSAGTVFLIAGLLHLVRSIYGWSLEINGANVPLWVSYLAVLITGVLAYYSFRFSREK